MSESARPSEYLRACHPSLRIGPIRLDMVIATKSPGILCVASACPDPPFEFMDGATPRGFDVEWMQAICREPGLQWRLDHYTGGDFNRIFDGLASGAWDCVASGTTINPDRFSFKSNF